MGAGSYFRKVWLLKPAASFKRWIGRRHKIFVHLLGLGRSATDFAQGKHPHHSDLAALRKGQHIAQMHAMRRFAAGLTVQAQMPRGHQIGRQHP